MKIAYGRLTCNHVNEYGHKRHPWGVALPEGEFCVERDGHDWNEMGVGDTVLVRYEPASQFATVITPKLLEEMLAKRR